MANLFLYHKYVIDSVSMAMSRVSNFTFDVLIPILLLDFKKNKNNIKMLASLVLFTLNLPLWCVAHVLHTGSLLSMMVLYKQLQICNCDFVRMVTCWDWSNIGELFS